MRLFLYQIAQTRSGDKANDSDVSLFAPNKKIYEFLKKNLTPDIVKSKLSSIVEGEVVRFEVPNLLALKFLLTDALGGGASGSLRSDNLGKSIGGIFSTLELDFPEEIVKDVKIRAA